MGMWSVGTAKAQGEGRLRANCPLQTCTAPDPEYWDLQCEGVVSEAESRTVIVVPSSRWSQVFTCWTVFAVSPSVELASGW